MTAEEWKPIARILVLTNLPRSPAAEELKPVLNLMFRELHTLPANEIERAVREWTRHTTQDDFPRFPTFADIIRMIPQTVLEKLARKRQECGYCDGMGHTIITRNGQEAAKKCVCREGAS